MTESPQMRWLRLWTDLIEDPKLLLLAPDDRWYYVAVLVVKRRGIIDEPDSPELRDRKIATCLRIDHRERDEVKRRLVEARLIDENWQPLGWDKRQFASDSSTDRVRTFRERFRNVSETDQNRDRTDTDTEQKQRGERFAPPPGLDEGAFEKWERYRGEIGKPLTLASILAAQRKLVAFGKDQAAVVEQSIANGWHGLFHLKTDRRAEKAAYVRASTTEELEARERARS